MNLNFIHQISFNFDFKKIILFIMTDRTNQKYRIIIDRILKFSKINFVGLKNVSFVKVIN